MFTAENVVRRCGVTRGARYRWVPSVVTTLLWAALQVSGYQNPMLARGLLILAVLFAVLFYWPLVRRVRFQLPIRLGPSTEPISRTEEIVGAAFENRTITLDNRAYTDCTFTNVTLRWNGGPFRLFRCRIDGPIRFETQYPGFVELIDLLKAVGFLEPGFAASWQHRGPEYFR